MSPNYRAWDISVRDFPRQGSAEDKLKFLLGFAVLAPSGHNTQPWNFSIHNSDDRNNEISLWVNRGRSLEGSDPNRRQLFIAFGCMIENLSIAANYYHYETSIHYFPDAHNHDLVAKLSLVEKNDDSKKTDGNLIFAIPLRHTNRGKYLDKPLPEVFLHHIEHYATDNLNISIVTNQEKKHAIADVVNEAQIETMDSPQFREELSHYIKSSFTKEQVGMPGFALEIPAPLSLIASRLIKKINVSRGSKKKDDALLKQYTPGGFMVISSKIDDANDQLAAGRLFEKIWLTATAEGLRCSPMAAAIQSPKHNAQLKKILDLDLQPQVFFRIGYGQKQYKHSPRFLVEDLLIHKK